MTQSIRVVFHRSFPPYEPGDEAGFPPLAARRFVDRGVASFADPRPVPGSLAAMGRAALVRAAVEVLGFEGDPPAEVSDDDIREALAAALASPSAADAVGSNAPDQLDALDRAHLEAFATSKAGFEAVDPALSDDELRAQIRAKVIADAAASDGTAATDPTPGAVGKSGKGR